MARRRKWICFKTIRCERRKCQWHWLLRLAVKRSFTRPFQGNLLINFHSRLEQEKYLVLLNNARICQFASTYCCGQAFSIMKINKSMLRTRVTDVHLDAVMRITVSSWKQHFATLVQWKRVQCSFFYREPMSYVYFWKCKQLFVVLCIKEVRFYCMSNPIELV